MTDIELLKMIANSQGYRQIDSLKKHTNEYILSISHIFSDKTRSVRR